MTDFVQTGLGVGPSRGEAAAVAAAQDMSGRSTNTDWAAIIAGAMIAGAISFIMGAFGSAIGLSMTSPYGGASLVVHLIALTLWVLWITVSSFAVGGYVTGRLRRRAGDVSQEEVEVRDGVHGLVLWAVAIVVFALIAGASIFQLAKTGVSAAASSEGARSETSSLAPAVTPVEERVDFLLRGDGDVNARGVTMPTEYPRAIVTRIVERGLATGEISGEDHAYLVNVLASRSGLAPQEAERRVDLSAERLREDQAKAKETAETARKTGILLAFLSAATMLLGAVAAWYGATLGGRHRDENVGVAAFSRF
ncbi:hypothetical protein [Methylocystis rosea]|uniref:hypothetical protein n=1 Tax=Methylocystis rosea TaxID=173366 RepID=UPI000378B381|nr:hypothetical protein [Methylocystis rosea]